MRAPCAPSTPSVTSTKSSGSTTFRSSSASADPVSHERHRLARCRSEPTGSHVRPNESQEDTMFEVAVRDSKTGLLMRDFLRYQEKAAIREVRNLAKIGQDAKIIPAN